MIPEPRRPLEQLLHQPVTSFEAQVAIRYALIFQPHGLLDSTHLLICHRFGARAQGLGQGFFGL
jgi:hypothetical protein